VQRAGRLPGCERALGLAGLLACGLPADRDVGVQPVVLRRDAVEVGVHDFGGCEVATAEPLGEDGRGREGEVVSHP